jgi:hypothetical protein
LTPEFKIGTIVMPLIEEKTGFGFAKVYPDQRCALCVNVATVARNVSRHSRNETAKLATPLFYHAGPGFENNMVPLQFSGDQEF